MVEKLQNQEKHLQRLGDGHRLQREDEMRETVTENDLQRQIFA